MKLSLLTISLILSTVSFSQNKKAAFEIDSLLDHDPGAENYRYWYGGGDHSICDFRMDTTLGKLSRFRYTSEGNDTVRADYFFINNYLVKVHSYRLKDGHITTIGTYYFNDNKIFYKTGQNVRLVV
jgi:hypothetical protein